MDTIIQQLRQALENNNVKLALEIVKTLENNDKKSHHDYHELFLKTINVLNHIANNAIYVILGNLDSTDPKQLDRETLLDIKNSAEKIKHFVQQVKALAMSDTPPPARLINLAAELKKLSASLSLPTDIPFDPVINGHPAALKEVISQLLSNAIEAANMNDGQINISCIASKGGVQMHFIDDGPGMTTSAICQSMMPFYTSNLADKPGLGLNIVQNISEFYGWTMEIQKNTTTPGTIVTLNFTPTIPPNTPAPSSE